MIAPPSRNWPRIINEVLQAGNLTPYKLALSLGLQLIQLQRIMDGSEPRHSVGELLLSLHGVMVTNVNNSQPQAADEDGESRV